MAGNDRGLTPRQRRTILTLMTAPSIKAAAEDAGVGERTLHRWLRERRFRDSYHFASELAMEETITTLRGSSGQAVMVLQQALHADSESLRVRAALGLLDMTAKLDDHFRRRLDDMDRRLTRDQTLEVAAEMAMIIKKFISDPEQRRAFSEELSRACNRGPEIGVSRRV